MGNFKNEGVEGKCIKGREDRGIDELANLKMNDLTTR